MSATTVAGAAADPAVGPIADPAVDPAVAYPETVPEVSESFLHTSVRFQAFSALRGHFEGRPGCFVGSDFNVYYRPLPAPAFVEPDLFVSFGVDPAALESDFSYRLWDAGAPPAFVVEIASKSTHRKDLHVKPAIYLEMGTSEYWCFDPTGGFYAPSLRGARRAGDAWEPIEVALDGEGRLRGRSGVLGLDLCAEESRLRFWDPRTAAWVPDHDDTRRALQRTSGQRDAEAAARRAAEQRATAAEAELAALKAQLADQ
ncbi:MAG: Uma2 family endonuclease [Acidimicrobiia bacterium]|nr:Uma2 family endonuclease [Acidimicrobiia bacterium]